MARKQDTDRPEVIEAVADVVIPSPPAFRPVLSGNIPRIRTAKDAKKILGRLISSFTRGEVASDDAKTLAYLLSTFVQIHAAVEIEERLEALELKK